MAEFIYFVKPVRPTFPGDGTPDEFAIVARHTEFLQEKLASGELILVGRTQDEQPIGICVFEAPSAEAATQFAHSDPAVFEGLFSVEVRPYSVYLMRGRD